MENNTSPSEDNILTEMMKEAQDIVILMFI